MKVYILSAPSNILFAENLLSNIKNITIVSASSIYELGADISRNLKHEIESADAILAIIDSKFSESTALNIELQIAQTSVQKHKNKILIPVILDAANIPVSVRNISCIICSSNSKEDLYQAQLTIENTLLHECHDTGRENLEKKNSKTLLYMVILTIATEIFAMSLIALTSYGQSLKMGGN